MYVAEKQISENPSRRSAEYPLILSFAAVLRGNARVSPPGFFSSPFWESRDGTNEIPALIRSSWKRAAGDDEGSDRPAS